MDANAMLSAFFDGLVEGILKTAFQLWYLFPILILGLIVKTPWFKGKSGEFLVNFLLSKFLDKNKYHLIQNVTLPTDDGTTQIDHIVVSQFGVFVIENKKYERLDIWHCQTKAVDTKDIQAYRQVSKSSAPELQTYADISRIFKPTKQYDSLGDCLYRRQHL